MLRNLVAVVLSFLTVIIVVVFPTKKAAAGAIELSAGFSYNRSNYSASNYNWNRRWGASVGYNFSERSGIEFSFQDITDRTKIVDYEDTTFHDKVYSINWMQAISGKDFPIQPYIKAGVGQLNREAYGIYPSGNSGRLMVDSVTGVLGAGLRIYITKNIGLRAEGTSFLQGGSIKKWRDNIGGTLGLSVYF